MQGNFKTSLLTRAETNKELHHTWHQNCLAMKVSSVLLPISGLLVWLSTSSPLENNYLRAPNYEISSARSRKLECLECQGWVMSSTTCCSSCSTKIPSSESVGSSLENIHSGTVRFHHDHCLISRCSMNIWNQEVSILYSIMRLRKSSLTMHHAYSKTVLILWDCPSLLHETCFQKASTISMKMSH